MPIALIFYTQKELVGLGYDGYIDFISKKVTNASGLGWPILMAVLYTLLSPGLSMLVKALQTYFDKWSDDWNLNILKASKISIDKYLGLRSALIQREETLVKVIEKESSVSEELERFKSLYYQTLNENETLNKQLTSYNNLQGKYDAIKGQVVNLDSLEEIFKGTWIWEFNLVQGTVSEPHMGFEDIFINGDQYYAHNTIRFSIRNIKHFKAGEVLTFYKKKLDQPDFNNSVILIKAGMNLWIGTETTSDGNFGYIRVYPKDRNKLPTHFPLMIPRLQSEDFVEVAKYFSKFKNEMQAVKF
ncbi:MAG: hypothetical protein JST49_13630 [Bacteroidetes bacterium]|nr:hypothetical protein [Bacteroidota bacterium]